MQRRTVTIKWDQLDDFFDEDDEFFESTNRISAVVPLDMPLSEFDDDYNPQEFKDNRVSFPTNLASNSIKENQNFMFATPTPGGEYDMWMVAPGSITDRRRRLLQGMGLNSNKDFTRLATNNFNKADTKKLVSTESLFTSLDTKTANENPNAGSVVKESSPRSEEAKHLEKKQPESQPSAKLQPQPQTEREPQPQDQVQEHVQDQSHVQTHVEVQDKTHVQSNDVHAKVQASFLPVLLIRSRSDSDIDTNSFNTKRRKEEIIGSISKQCLTRTSSELVTASVGLSSQYENIVRVLNTEQTKRSSVGTANNKDNTNNATSNAQLDSFFLIKNLDTGKEFVVKESNDEGHKVSDLQTGEQLTMDEFEKTVGHSPMVKELMRRTSRKRSGTGKLASTNSLISKSFRNSKKKGAALLKNIKSSVKGSKVEKDKDDSVATTTTAATDNTSSSSSQTEEQKTSKETKSSKEKKTSKAKKTSKEQKASGEKKTSSKQKTKQDPKNNSKQKTSGEQKNGGEQNTIEEQQKTSGEQKTGEGQQKTSGEQKVSTDKNPSSEWVKARAHGKPIKEFSALHLCQEIQAHDGSIWTMRFSCDGQYLATGGEDMVIHVWEVQECDVMSMLSDGKGSLTPDNRPPLPDGSATPSDKKKKSKKKKGVPDYVKVPETMFGLSDIPICTFEGHQDDVLDLSWSTSQLLLSSSMDKTVRLWDMATKNCLKQFTHSDYVTCIHFNPTDEDYFISGSLDTKVRIWSIPSRKVVDWCELHDMITAIGYYPDGQGAIVGLHTGDCKSYSTADCKLEQKDQIELHTKAKADPKKITGFQFSPSNPSEVLVTSADSRIRIVDGSHVVTKLIGYKNTSSQFLAHYSADGKYIICASEDSQVFIWKHERPKSSGGAKTKYVTTTSYEHFPCTEVTVVVPWSGSSKLQRSDNEPQSKRSGQDPGMVEDNVQTKKLSQLPPIPKNSTEKGTNSTSGESEQPSRSESSVGTSDFGDTSSRSDGGNNNNNNAQSTAWGLVIVTAGVGGEIKVYQNVGLPVKVGTNLF